MFSISDKDIAAIQAAFARGGELSATIEVRRIFPGIPDNAEARRIALIIAGSRSVLASDKRPLNRRAASRSHQCDEGERSHSSASPGAFNHRHPSTE